MARSRNIKPGFFKNEYLAEVSPHARLLFVGLWTLSDREGRLEDRPKKIRAELFPYENCDIEKMLTELEESGFILRYDINGSSYLQIFNFVKHQDPHYKEKVSEIQPPPGHENQISASNITRTQRKRIMDRDEYTCKYCDSDKYLSIDHVIPVSRGGDSSDGNLQVLCMSCNTKKSNKLDGESRARKKNKDIETDHFDPDKSQVQPDVDPNLIQQNGPSPSSSLIPDSLNLIPDSLNLIPDSPEERSQTEDDGMTELVEAWNNLPSGVAPKVRVKNSKAIKSGWEKVSKSSETREYFQDIPKLMEQIRGSPFLHKKGWFRLPWLFAKGGTGEWNIIKVMEGAYEQSDTSRGNRPVGGGENYDPSRKPAEF